MTKIANSIISLLRYTVSPCPVRSSEQPAPAAPSAELSRSQLQQLILDLIG